VSVRTPLEARTAFMEDIHREVLSPKRKRTPGISDSLFAKLREEAIECAQRGDWSLAGPRHFVAHYAHLHERVYGLAPSELDSKARTRATFVVTRLLEREFGGDKKLLASYCRWIWNRENGRHEYRRANGRPLTRMTWNLAFGGYCVTDWRLATGGK
jgi:hypothetical protein